MRPDCRLTGLSSERCLAFAESKLSLLQTAARSRRLWFSVANAARKKVNQEMAPERFSRLRRPRSRVQSSLRRIGSRAVVRKPLNGRQPPHLNAMKLMRLTALLPTDWVEQRRLLGFR